MGHDPADGCCSSPRAATMNVVMVAWLMVAMPATAFAQAAIAGAVKGPSGAPLPGVFVETASRASIETFRAAPTDGDGRYRIEDLRPGTYLQVTVTPLDVHSAKREFTLSAGVIRSLPTACCYSALLVIMLGNSATSSIVDVVQTQDVTIVYDVNVTVDTFDRWRQHFNGLGLTVNVRTDSGVMVVGGKHIISQTTASPYGDVAYGVLTPVRGFSAEIDF